MTIERNIYCAGIEVKKEELPIGLGFPVVINQRGQPTPFHLIAESRDDVLVTGVKSRRRYTYTGDAINALQIREYQTEEDRLFQKEVKINWKKTPRLRVANTPEATKVKIPTQEDYLSYDGKPSWRKWRELADDWCCPGCDRTKYQIMRWAVRFASYNPTPQGKYEGWLAAFHKHHDHSSVVEYVFDPKNANIIEEVVIKPERFPETRVCDHCNSVDSQVKKKFQNHIPDNFSFSPEEIRQMITATPHAGHVIDYEKAWKIYVSLNTKDIK